MFHSCRRPQRRAGSCRCWSCHLTWRSAACRLSALALQVKINIRPAAFCYRHLNLLLDMAVICQRSQCAGSSDEYASGYTSILHGILELLNIAVSGLWISCLSVTALAQRSFYCRDFRCESRASGTCLAALCSARAGKCALTIGDGVNAVLHATGHLRGVKVEGGRQRNTHWLRRRHPARSNSAAGGGAA